MHLSWIKRFIMKNKDFYIKLIFGICLSYFTFDLIIKPTWGNDYFYQIAAGLNLFDGKGYSWLQDVDGCGLQEYSFFSKFPLGYSFLTGIYLKIHNDIMFVNDFYKGLSLMLSLFLIHNISSKLTFNSFQKFTLMSMYIFFIHNYGHVVDYLSLTAIIGSVCFFSISNQNKFYLSISLSFVVLAYLLRYAYYPQIFAVPIAIFILYLFDKNHEIKKAQLIGLISFALFTIVYLFTIKYNSKSINQLETLTKISGGNWNFQHILHFRPLFIDYFFDTYRIYSFLGVKSSGFDRGFLIPFIYRIILLAGSLSIYIYSCWYLFKRFRISQNEIERRFLTILLVISISNLCFIYGLSIYYPSPINEYTWTWAMLPRYFLINYFSFSIFLVYLLSDLEKRKTKFVLAFLFFSFLVNLSDKLRLNFSYYSTFRKENIELRFPNRNINEYNTFYNNFKDQRSNYCIIYDPDDFKSFTDWNTLDVYSKLLDFNKIPIDKSEGLNKESRRYRIKDKNLFLFRKNKNSP